MQGLVYTYGDLEVALDARENGGQEPVFKDYLSGK
jgi:hypothetical protein